MSDQALIIGRPASAGPMRVEIARSFSYKLNVGNYESRDFFCSQKAECSFDDAVEVSAALFQFCRAEVLRAVKEYMADAAKQKEQKTYANSR